MSQSTLMWAAGIGGMLVCFSVAALMVARPKPQPPQPPQLPQRPQPQLPLCVGAFMTRNGPPPGCRPP
jgi:hypothetical protein